jgi:hypothetical protein
VTVAELFTREELASYAQQPVDNATADLLLALVTIEIREHVGEVTYDAMSDVGRLRFKGIALEAVKRALLNPGGVRQFSTTIDDYSESQTYATETFGGVELSESELQRIDRLLGRASGAFTIRAVAEPGYYGRRPGHHHYS